MASQRKNASKCLISITSVFYFVTFYTCHSLIHINRKSIKVSVFVTIVINKRSQFNGDRDRHSLGSTPTFVILLHFLKKFLFFVILTKTLDFNQITLESQVKILT